MSILAECPPERSLKHIPAYAQKKIGTGNQFLGTYLVPKSKKGYTKNCVTLCFYWWAVSESNREPTD